MPRNSKLLQCICVVILLTSLNIIYSQESYTYEDAFEARLKELNKEVQVRYQLDDIEQEKYLLEFMRHVTTEIRARYPNKEASSSSSSDDLESIVKEIDRLIPSLQNNKAQPNVIKLANDLRNDVQTAINSDDISDNKRRKINKAVQLLSIVENSLKKGNSTEAQKFSSSFEALLQSPKTGKDSRLESSNEKIDQWEKNEILKFKLDEKRLQYYQQKLLAFATDNEKNRMAKDFFRRALLAFNYFEYKTALSILNNMIENYTFVRNKAILHYYAGLSYYYENNFIDAKFHLELAIKNNSIDKYAAFVLSKIYRTYENVDGLKSITSVFEKLANSDGNYNDDFYFTVGTSLYELEKYPEAKSNLQKVTPTYELYNDAQYMLASITSTTNKVEAKNQFKALIARPDIHPELRNECILKIGYIAYENKEYDDAIFWFNEINQDEYPDYEKVLIGKAWSYYEKEMLKPETVAKKFVETKHYTNLLINNFTSSDYLSEAKALLGYAKQKSNNLEGAEIEFSNVFEGKAYKLLSDDYLTELDSLRETRRKIEKLIEKSVEKNNMAAFKRLEDMKYEVDKDIYRLTYMDNASASPSNTKDFQIVTKQVQEFEQLKKKAIEKNETAIVKRIDENLVRLYVVLNEFKTVNEPSIFGQNYFKEQALARKVSLIENRNKKYEEMSKETKEQYNYLTQKIDQLKKQRDSEQKKNNFKRVNQIDVTLYRLEKALARLNSINTYAESQNKYKLADNLDKWANYSAYQLTNIQYFQREKLEQENQASLETLNRINEVVRNRNIVLAEQIKQIDNRIVNLTRKETRERRIEERNKTRDLVNQEFYDETAAEINEDSVRNALEQLAIERALKRNRLNGKIDSTQIKTDTMNNQKSLDIKDPVNNDDDKNQENKTDNSSATKNDEDQ